MPATESSGHETAHENEEQQDKTPETLEPLTGILTLRKRKIDTNRWACLLCKTKNGVMWTHCKACHRDRYPPWLKDLHGNIVHPGLIITPDSTQMGMVTKVSRSPAQITAFFLQVKEGKPVHDWELEERIIPSDKVADHELVREPKHAEPFLNFGLCGDCNRVYHIRYGNTFVYSENDVSLVKIRISRKATDIHKLQENKAKLLKARQKEGVLECTKQIKVLKREMELLHCQLGGATTWCPFCLWRPTF